VCVCVVGSVSLGTWYMSEFEAGLPPFTVQQCFVGLFRRAVIDNLRLRAAVKMTNVSCNIFQTMP